MPHLPISKLWSSQEKRRWLIAAAVVLAVLLAGVLVLVGFSARAESVARTRLVEVLKQQYESDVTLDRLSVSVFPRFVANGEGLVLRHRGRTDVPPLISIKKISIQAGLFGLLVNRLRSVRLEGLEIHVPPRQHGGDKERETSRGGRSRIIPFVIGEIVADGAFLEIIPKKPGAEPLTFDISQLRMHAVDMTRPMPFRAILTNPKPPGLIHSTGEFGPWERDEPSLTPVTGSYTFENADLSVFRGLAGILSSEGKYNGALERIEVQGSTDTPDFAVRISGNPVHLKTQFNAVVDGTNGDTLLQPVNAQFLRSSLVARGGVQGFPGRKGKAISLDVAVSNARLEDMLRLGVKSEPPMTGVIAFRTKLVIPPGQEDIADKMSLNGQFGVGAAEFTSPTVQQKVQTLSHKAQGEPKNEESERVLSNFKGRFLLKDGVIKFSKLSFEVPGALVHLDGTYALHSGKLDFQGTLRMQAKLSQTTSGIKSFFLKAVDPFFKKEGAGAVLPIKITGTREQPVFGLNLGQASKSK